MSGEGNRSDWCGNTLNEGLQSGYGRCLEFGELGACSMDDGEESSSEFLNPVVIAKRDSFGRDQFVPNAESGGAAANEVGCSLLVDSPCRDK